MVQIRTSVRLYNLAHKDAGKLPEHENPAITQNTTYAAKDKMALDFSSGKGEYASSHMA